MCVLWFVSKNFYFKEISYAKFHRNPSNMNGWYAAIKVLKNALCFIMGYLVAMVIRVMLFVLVQFFIVYIVQVKAMCVPILRSIGSELTTLLIGIMTRNILKPTRSLYDFRFKSYGSNSGFRVFSDLDLWHMFYFCVLFTRIAHDVLEYPCEVSLESVQYEWVICCG